MRKFLKRYKKDHRMMLTSFWIFAFLTIFIFIGSNARPLVWVFIAFGILTYYILDPKKRKQR